MTQMYSTEIVLQTAQVISDESAGNKPATMTDLDLAASMLVALVKQRDELLLGMKMAQECFHQEMPLSACEWINQTMVNVTGDKNRTVSFLNSRMLKSN